MKNVLKAVLPAAGAVAAAAGLAAFMIAPGKAGQEKKAPFMGRNIAHRGLHTLDKTVPENSLAAFRRAVEAGYGVEFDVHITKDDRLVVFHDDDLLRMCGVPERVEDMSYDYLRSLRLAGSEERIPLLAEVLQVIGGEVPIVLELKRGGRNVQLCQRVHEMLRCYRGDVCIESFDPFIVRWWRKNAPEMLRGQLSCRREKFGANTSPLNAFLLSNLLTNFLCRPHFIAYGVCYKKPLTVRISEKMGAMRVAWTSLSEENEKTNDAAIFEHYAPEIKFK